MNYTVTIAGSDVMFAAGGMPSPIDFSHVTEPSQPFIRPSTTYAVNVTCIPYFYASDYTNVNVSSAIGFWSNATIQSFTTASDGESAHRPPTDRPPTDRPPPVKCRNRSSLEKKY